MTAGMRKVLPILLIVIGALGLFTTSSVVFQTASILLHAGSAPKEATVATAAPQAWVRLDDAVLRCDTRQVVHGSGDAANTVFLAADRAGANPFVAHFLGDVSCEQAQKDVNGVFLPGTATPESLQRVGVDTRGATHHRLFTQALRPTAARSILLRTLVWVALSLLMIFLGLRQLRKLRAASAPPAPPAA